jgi:cell division protein FtsB
MTDSIQNLVHESPSPGIVGFVRRYWTVLVFIALSMIIGTAFISIIFMNGWLISESRRSAWQDRRIDSIEQRIDSIQTQVRKFENTDQALINEVNKARRERNNLIGKMDLIQNLLEKRLPPPPVAK